MLGEWDKGPLWQNRYWDHQVRDQADFNAHLDYIHYNPVKHGYVEKPAQWEYSSFQAFLDQGYYQADWGVTAVGSTAGDFGE